MKSAFLLLSVLILNGCVTHSAYSTIGRSESVMMDDDAFIVGLEKISKSRSKYSYSFKESTFKPLESESCVTSNQMNASKLERDYCQQYSDFKPVTITHMVQFPGPQYWYNAYSNGEDGTYGFKAGFNSLATLEEELFKAIVDPQNNYSHVIVSSMGWNNDQFEAVDHYQKILKNLKTENSEIKPILIGITWPSVWGGNSTSGVLKWFGHKVSYINKANDADEIGYTYMNLILNDLIPSLRERIVEHNNSSTGGEKVVPMMVGIGHSFGSRIMTRALFSESHLKNSERTDTKGLDLYISLMGAFSAKRFTDESGEGSPYMSFADLDTKLVLVGSWNDTANSFAGWSKHVGGKHGLKYMAKHDSFKEIDWVSKSDSNLELISELGKPSNAKVLSINATAIVVKRLLEDISAHNDIDDEEMAELLNFIVTNTVY